MCCFFCIFWLFLFSLLLVNAVYFPMAVVNLTLPAWRKIPGPLPPLLELNALPEGPLLEENFLSYSILSQSTSGLFLLDQHRLRLNQVFTGNEPKFQSVVVIGRAGLENPGNTTINLEMTGDKINCEKSKRNLCFWNEVSYRIPENVESTPLGQLSSPFYLNLCPNYSLSYKISKGGEHVTVSRIKSSGRWMVFAQGKAGQEKGKVFFGVKCTVSTSGSAETFEKNFEIEIFRRQSPQVFLKLAREISTSSVFHEGEKVASGMISDPGGSQVDRFRLSLANDTGAFLRLECLPTIVRTLSAGAYANCELKAQKTVHLNSPHSVFVRIEDTQLPVDDPNRLQFRNISLQPVSSKPDEQPLELSVNPEESFMLNLRYPESAVVSRRAVALTRVVEPILENSSSDSDVRTKVVAAKIKFGLLSAGPFNITEFGGIVFVSSRGYFKDYVYKIKITGTYPNGYRFLSTVRINITDTKPLSEDGVCEKSINESIRPSCSEKRFKSDCEKTCGVSSGRVKSGTGLGCAWRSNKNPEKLSRLYQTCSPDLLTCPDRFCDPLESAFPKICPQDCSEYVFGSANKENHVPGIASATGVCTCDNRQKCLCTLPAATESFKQNDRKKPKPVANDSFSGHQREVISAIKASYVDHCGTVCLLSITGGAIVFVFSIFLVFFLLFRRKLKKRCPNQEHLKEDMVNINYEEYVERPGDILRPLGPPNTAIKEIPEYYDKKWEFPRHRLTIEDTLGEGEFGKVLKARADGIAGHDGPITVAVKTLKENAKETELADLISEYQLLKEIDHPNVIHLLGACTKLDGPVYVIIEYAEHGSLRNYLRKHRRFNSSEKLWWKETETSYVQAITPKDILTFAWQIAKGMNYLTEMKLVHRDLAARNVLVAEGLICKISDFGLTRDIYEDDTYLKRSKGRVPVKWMALESLADHVYTTKSDVWSYGVVLWELVTTGASPYPGIAGQNLFHLLKNGYRMERPPNCSHELYQILRSCWQENPSHRPTFKSLVVKFEEMLAEGKDYLDLNPRTVENKTYFSELLNDGGDERDLFLPRDENSSEVIKLKFGMFENNKKSQRCSKCSTKNCDCEPVLRYENEQQQLRPKYENQGMEDTGYVQPTSAPKPVDPTNSDLNLNLAPHDKQIAHITKV